MRNTHTRRLAMSTTSTLWNSRKRIHLMASQYGNQTTKSTTSFMNISSRLSSKTNQKSSSRILITKIRIFPLTSTIGFKATGLSSTTLPCITDHSLSRGSLLINKWMSMLWQISIRLRCILLPSPINCKIAGFWLRLGCVSTKEIVIRIRHYTMPRNLDTAILYAYFWRREPVVWSLIALEWGHSTSLCPNSHNSSRITE